MTTDNKEELKHKILTKLQGSYESGEFQDLTSFITNNHQQISETDIYSLEGEGLIEIQETSAYRNETGTEPVNRIMVRLTEKGKDFVEKKD